MAGGDPDEGDRQEAILPVVSRQEAILATMNRPEPKNASQRHSRSECQAVHIKHSKTFAGTGTFKHWGT